VATSKYTSTVEERLGKAIARERTALGLTQEELAQAIGVQQETISQFERGAVLPPLQRLIQLADVFDIPLDNLVRGTTNRRLDGMRTGSTIVPLPLPNVDSDGGVRLLDGDHRSLPLPSDYAGQFARLASSE